MKAKIHTVTKQVLYNEWFMDQGLFVLLYWYHYGVPSAAVRNTVPARNGPGLPLPGPDDEVDLPESPRNAGYR